MPSGRSDVDVIVVGGGIAGSTLCAALHMRGMDTVLLERATELQPLGAGIALMPPALDIAHNLGMLDSFQESSVGLPFLRRCSADGAVLLEASYPGLWSGRDVRAIKRSTLSEILLAAVPERCIRLGHDVVSVRDDGTAAVVQLADGEEMTASVVVAADGVHSKVRQSLFPTLTPSCAGQRYLRSFLPGEALVDTYTAWVGRGTAFGLVPLLEGTHVFGFESTTTTELRPSAGRAAEVRHRFADFTASAVRESLVRLDDEHIHEGPGWEVEVPPARWRRGRVVMLGDAAHAIPPPLGLGGALAMEDSWVLAEELHRGDADNALDRWVARRAPRVQHIQAATRAWLEATAAGTLRDPEATLRRSYEPMLEPV